MCIFNKHSNNTWSNNAKHTTSKMQITLAQGYTLQGSLDLILFNLISTGALSTMLTD